VNNRLNYGGDMKIDPTYIRLLAKQSDDIMMAIATFLERIRELEVSEVERTLMLTHGHHAEDHLISARDDLERMANLLEGKKVSH